MDVADRQVNSRFEGRICIADLVMLFVTGFQTTQNQKRLFPGGFRDVNFLETSCQGVIFFEELSVFFIGCCPYTAQFPGGQGRFQQIGSIHWPSCCCSSSYDCVDFINEKD